MDKRSIIFVIALTIALFLFNQWFGGKGDTKRQEQIATQQKVAQQEKAKEASSAPLSFQPDQKQQSTEEKFYVLENDYQQIVFSNVGGAIAEINLTLKSKEKQKSVILPIEFDKKMEKEYTANDHFPLYPSQTANSQVQEGKVGGYYPLLRRSIIGTNYNPAFKISPRFYAFNLVNDDPDSGNVIYNVTRFDKNSIEFQATEQNRRVIKKFTLPQNEADIPYVIDVSIKVEGDSRGLWLTSGVPEVELISDSFSPALKYRITRQNKPSIEQIDLPKTSSVVTSVQPDWISNSNGFFGVILDPLKETGAGFSAYRIPGEMAPTRISLIDRQYDLYPVSKYPGYETRLPLKASGQATDFRLFAGPYANDILKKVDAAYPINPDFTGAQSFHGWFSFISEPFAKFLFILLKFFYMITHSWGISIILLTAALRLILYPLNAWSIKSTAKMQQIAPQVSAIQERHKKDPKRAQTEIMTLYKEKGVNPLTGCFPILIQMPFLIGMFDLLKSAFELRGASFIPGWIDNLTAPDVVFSWNYPILFFGTSFHLLPIILGLVMYFQQKMSSTLPKDKSLLTDQQKQQKMMGNIMAIVFTVMFYHFPSGLNIYWLSSMLFGILQQWYTTRKMLAAPVERVKIKG